MTTPGTTRRGVVESYRGGNEKLCNAPTKTGGYCRALGLLPAGLCLRHGGNLLEHKKASVEARQLAKDKRAREKLKAETAEWLRKYRKVRYGNHEVWVER